MDESLSGLLSSLQDKYTEYLPKPKTQQFEQNISGELEGIGAQLGTNDARWVFIAQVFPDTPAERARLTSGDIILKVNGTDMTGKTPPEVATFIKGPKGTTSS